MGLFCLLGFAFWWLGISGLVICVCDSVFLGFLGFGFYVSGDFVMLISGFCYCCFAVILMCWCFDFVLFCLWV